MELDEWELSAEELDSIEKDAVQRIAQERNSSSSSSSSHSFSFDKENPQYQHSHSVPSTHSNNRPISFSPSNKVQALSQSSRALPTSVVPKPHNGDEDIKEPGQKLGVKISLHSTGNLAAKFPYNTILVDAFRRIPKATWNAKERLWMFPVSSLPSVEKILSQISEVENLDPFVQRAIGAASRVLDLQDRYGEIPDYIESKLLPFQRDGVRFILQHGGRALLADEMGLGKTIQAIAVTTCIRESWPVLILTPSSLRLHWASMIQQWLNIPSTDIVVVLSQAGGSNRGGFTIVSSNNKGTIHLDGVFNIISYDVVPKLQHVLIMSEFKVVIADESHFLKNAQAKRTNASLPVIKKARYAILLSGTPALSRPIELFKQLEALYPGVYSNVHEYGNRYCKGGIFGIYQGASNHEELHNLIKATVMIRRLKKDVLSELPVKRRQQVNLWGTGKFFVNEERVEFVEILTSEDLTTHAYGVFLDLTERDMKPINALFRELEVIKTKIKACESEEEVESLKFSEKTLINKIYNDSAEAKIPAVLNYLGTVIEAGCKFLIFAHHQSMIDAIYQFLLKKKVGCIRIDGSTSASLRQALVTDFQEKDSIKAAVLSIKAGGVGLTLTAASTVIFAELSWTPGDLIQAEDRVHRIGQVSSVNIYYLLANDTVDDIIWDVVQSKLENLGQMLDGHENTMEVSSTSSPTKQKTLHSFLKRCNNGVDAEQQQPKVKPRWL